MVGVDVRNMQVGMGVDRVVGVRDWGDGFMGWGVIAGSMVWCQSVGIGVFVPVFQKQLSTFSFQVVLPRGSWDPMQCLSCCYLSHFLFHLIFSYIHLYISSFLFYFPQLFDFPSMPLFLLPSFLSHGFPLLFFVSLSFVIFHMLNFMYSVKFELLIFVNM